MDLDCMVAMSGVLGRNVTYEEYQIINRTDLYDNMGLFNIPKMLKMDKAGDVDLTGK